MKKLIFILSLFILFGLTTYSNDNSELITIYDGSKLIHDDKIGFEEYYIFINENTVETIEGNIRRRFCIVPSGNSPLQVIRNYRLSIEEQGGEIIFTSRKARDLEANNIKFWDYFSKERVGHTRNYEYMRFFYGLNEYLVGKINRAGVDIYIIVGASNADGTTTFDLVTVETEAMKLNKVSINDLRVGLENHGKAVVYDIFFDSGKSQVKAESSEALKIISEYLNANPNKKYLVVGHTDNVGNFDMNIKLSNDRANAIVRKLVRDYGVKIEQLKPYGIGPASPLTSNSTEAGRSKNRRVEIVEQ